MRAPRPGSRWSIGRLYCRIQYAAYMDSPEWFERRERWYTDYFALAGTPPVCAVCGRAWLLEDGDLHHRSYERLGHEHHHDLLPLCRAHHSQLHALWDACPAWRRLGHTQATTGIIAALRRNLTTAHQGRTEHP